PQGGRAGAETGEHRRRLTPVPRRCPCRTGAAVHLLARPDGREGGGDRLTPTGTKDDGSRPVDRPMVRAGIVVTGAAVLSAVAIGAGLVFTEGEPDHPAEEDPHTTAPGCDAVPQEALDELLADAVLESEEHGPLVGGEKTTCGWVSTEESDGGSVRVWFALRITDNTAKAPVSGEVLIAEVHAALAPSEGEEFFPVEGVTGWIWSGSCPGTAELAYPVENLLVRVSCSGHTVSDAWEPTDAQERALRFAERLGENL